MRRLWRRFARDRRAGVATTVGLSLVMIVGFAALAVDLGSVFLQTRQLQGMADLAALGAARDLGNAQAAAAATANGNHWKSPIQTLVVLGVYRPDSSLKASQRFTQGGASPNAVQVTLTTQANLYFGAVILGRQSFTISRTATAAQAQLASFAIGSRLLALQGGIANSVLSALTGSQVNLSVMDYNALASANIDLLQYSQALQTDLKLQGSSFQQVLSSQVSTGEALSVLANLLDTNGNDPAAVAIRKIATAAGNTTPANLSQLINLGPYGGQDHTEANSGAGVQVGALDLTNTMLQLSQGGHQIALTTNTDVPGIAKVDGWLAIGQRPNNSPWLAIDDAGNVIISTAQTRLYVVAQVAPGSGVLSTAGASLVTIPIYVEAASAQAKLSALSCPTSTSDPAVTLAVAPSVGQIDIGQIDTTKLGNFQGPLTVSPAQLINLALLKVTGSSQVNIGGLTWQPVSFSQSDIQSNTVKTVTTNDIAQATVTSLLTNLNMNVQLGGLNLGLGQNAITSALQPVLTSAAAPLDATIGTLESMTGVKLGQADVWVNGLRCHDAALVA